MGEVLLDVSGLEAPEPLRRAIEAALALREGQFLRMCHRMKPLHLYPWLEAEGFDSDTRRGDQGCEIFIWRRNDPVAGRAARSAASPLEPWRECV
jgi:hypothetical protein